MNMRFLSIGATTLRVLFFWQNAVNDHRVNRHRDCRQENNQISHLSLTFRYKLLPTGALFQPRLTQRIDLDQDPGTKDIG